MINNKKQLYKFLPDVEYPSVLRFDENTGEVLTNKNKVEGVYLFNWPDGSTCFPVEMYLSYISEDKLVKKSDGGTVGNYATALTHLVRYCFYQKVEFWELTTSHIDKLITELTNEKKSNGFRARSNNTIKKQILPKIVAFLKWLQSEHFPTQYLIGVDAPKKRYQIKLVIRKKKNKSGRGFGDAEVFPCHLPDSIPQPKAPMASAIIKKLWDTLNEAKDTNRLNDFLLSKIDDENDRKDHLDYMYHRRRFQLEMLEATGLRPQELVDIKFSTNETLIENKKIEIPTYKREDSRYRTVPLPQSTAIKVEVFMFVHRAKLISRLVKYDLIGDESEIDDFIFLNPETGKRVKPSAAYQEFKRLSNRAGIDVQSCQSMFRHRFVTNMVKIHLVSFMDNNPLKNQYTMVERDYATILKKVRSFTDHKDETSLDTYIDLAWDELEAFSFSYEIHNLHSRFRAISKLVSDLKFQINRLNLSESILLPLFETLEEIDTEANLLVDISNSQN